MAWADLAAQMDEIVDAELGDTITFSSDAGASWTNQQGFVLPAAMTGGLTGMDEPLGMRSRVKLPRALFANGAPDRNVRIRHPSLGANTYRSAGGEPEDQGRYILFDIQRV